MNDGIELPRAMRRPVAAFASLPSAVTHLRDRSTSSQPAHGQGAVSLPVSSCTVAVDNLLGQTSEVTGPREVLCPVSHVG
jgi:hypothetical protein